MNQLHPEGAPGSKASNTPNKRNLQNFADVKQKRSASELLYAALAAAALMLIAYAGAAHYFSKHFLPHTYIDGVEVSGMTAEEAKKALSAGAGDLSLVFAESSGETESLSLAEINCRRSYEAPETALRAQGALLWPFRMRGAKQADADFQVLYDADALAASVDALRLMQPERMEAPADAYIEKDEATGDFVIVPETAGSTVDRAKLLEVIDRALNRGQNRIDLAAEGCYQTAEITEENEALLQRLSACRSYQAVGLCIDLGAGCTEQVDGTAIYGFFDHTDGAVLSLAAIRGYAAELAARYDTASDSRRRLFNTSEGRTVSIRTSYGWKLDADATAQRIYDVLNAYFNGGAAESETAETESAASSGELPLDGDSGETAGSAALEQGNAVQNAETAASAQGLMAEAVWSRKAVSHKPRDIGDTYAEVDLTNQTVYFVKDKICIFTSPCVTGKLVPGRATPDGIYTLTYKQPGKVLTGRNPDGSIAYRSPVSFWMPFNGGIGFHDATWRSKFGGTLYKNGGSHGCINMPYDKAKELYGLVYQGVPVVCYF